MAFLVEGQKLGATELVHFQQYYSEFERSLRRLQFNLKPEKYLYVLGDFATAFNENYSKLNLTKCSSTIQDPNFIDDCSYRTLIAAGLDHLSQINSFQKLESELKFTQESNKYIPKQENFLSFQKYHRCFADETTKRVYLISEAWGPNLLLARKSCSKSLHSDDILNQITLATEMAYPVRILHDWGLAHCDLKLESYVYSDKTMAAIYFTDFGETTEMEFGCKGGSHGFMPPKQINENPGETTDKDKIMEMSQKQDIFSLGVLLSILIHDSNDATKIIQLSIQLHSNPSDWEKNLPGQISQNRSRPFQGHQKIQNANGILPNRVWLCPHENSQFNGRA